MADEIVGRLRGRPDGDVRIALGNVQHPVVDVEVDRDLGVELVQLREQRREHERARRIRGGHANDALQILVPPPDPALERADLLLHPFGLPRDLQRGGGGDEALARAVEQPHAELLLDGLDAPGNRDGIDAELTGGAGERTRAVHGQNVTKAVPLHAIQIMPLLQEANLQASTARLSIPPSPSSV